MSDISEPEIEKDLSDKFDGVAVSDLSCQPFI